MSAGDWREVSDVDPDEIRAWGIARRLQGNQRTKNIRDYMAIPIAFDIETSRVEGMDHAVLYHWQLQIGPDSQTVHGRDWESFDQLIKLFLSALKGRETVVIYVHNLSYEWQFLRTIYPFSQDEVFAVQPRKILKATMYDRRIEFRCSYLLTNEGLGSWTKKMEVEHPKLDSEEYQHNLIRYPWTDLSEQELQYCRHDVLGLVEALIVQMNRDGDTLATIPLTSTGYVRRDAKHSLRLYSRWAMLALQPDERLYRLLHTAFAGGNTHANRWYAGDILENVYSYDRSSSYPDVVVNDKFPMSPFKPWLELTTRELRRLRRLDRALLIFARFENIRLRDPLIGCPPISFSKTTGCGNKCLDNGRILWADWCELAFTDVDLRIYEDAYTWDNIVILQAYHARYDYLPVQLRMLAIDYYVRKTTLKGVDGKEQDYNLAKALLNAIFGMMAQDPCKQDSLFNGVDFEPGPEDLPTKLAKNKGRAFLSYSWGIFVTALARYRLWEAIRAADSQEGGYTFVYCDTDSVKTTQPLDLSKYNAERIAASKANGAYADDPSGTTHYMGVFEYEGCYTSFATLGAKKYAYEDKKGLHCTIAGVNKRHGADELGALENFKPGFIFRRAGGLESKYNDVVDETVIVDGHELHIGPNVFLKPSEYTLGITREYDDILSDPDLFVSIAHDYYTRPLLDEGPE